MHDFFFRNPRLLVLSISLIVVAGLSSFMLLPRLEDPVLTPRVSTINTVYPGANAKRVEALVTDPIEDAMSEIVEIKEIRSQSRSGASLVTITLADEVQETATIWSRVRDKLDDASREFPAGVREPDFRELDMKAYALLVAVQWDSEMPTSYAILRRHAESLKDRLLAVAGTEKIRLYGDPEEEYTATIDASRMTALGLTAIQVSAAVRESDSKVSAGLLRGAENDYLLEVDGELTSLDRVLRTPIRVGTDGHVVRLEDVATVSKGIVQPVSSMAIIEGRPSIVLGVLVRNEQRIDRWTQRVADVLEQARDEVPDGIRIEPVFQQNEYVDSRLAALLGNLLLGAAGVSLVVFLLMGWRSALIVGMALPLSSLMVLSGMRWLGIPIHQMSITGLIIAIGLLIDNAIVMVDEIGVKLRGGVSPGTAVRGTVRHLAVPLLGSTVTTALAFAPIALMTGPAGEFVASIAVSVILAIFSSLLVSLTIVPALTAWGIGSADRASFFQEGLRFERLAGLYSRSIDVILRFPLAGAALGVCLPLLGFLAATQLPEQFFPPADRNQCQIEVELPSQASMEQTLSVTRAIRRVIRSQYPAVDRIHWFLGESAPTFYYNVVPRREHAANYAQAMVDFQDGVQTRDLIRDMQRRLDHAFPGARILVRQLEQGPPFDAPVEVRIFGPSLDVLRELGEGVRERLARVQDVLHTRSDLAESISKLSVEVDEERARLVGLDHTQIANQLHATLEGVAGGSVLESTEELPVRVRWSNASRSRFDDIASVELIRTTPMTDARSIPLSAVAEIRVVPESATIPHRNAERMNEVQAYITAGVLPAKVLGAIKASLGENPLALPAGYRIEFGGEAAERDDAVGNLLSNVSVLVILMIATLVMSFGSFRLSAIIGLVAGLSLGLGLGALWIFSYPFGFMAIIGSMGLMGVAINDAIVVLAGIQANQAARRGDREAVREVVLQTTRHIVATSLTTMAGFAPLVMAGGEFWPPLAIAISGGVGGATILALYFVPSLYLMLLFPRRVPAAMAA